VLNILKIKNHQLKKIIQEEAQNILNEDERRHVLSWLVDAFEEWAKPESTTKSWEDDPTITQIHDPKPGWEGTRQNWEQFIPYPPGVNAGDAGLSDLPGGSIDPRVYENIFQEELSILLEANSPDRTAHEAMQLLRLVSRTGGNRTYAYHYLEQILLDVGANDLVAAIKELVLDVPGLIPGISPDKTKEEY